MESLLHINLLPLQLGWVSVYQWILIQNNDKLQNCNEKKKKKQLQMDVAICARPS